MKFRRTDRAKNSNTASRLFKRLRRENDVIRDPRVTGKKGRSGK